MNYIVLPLDLGWVSGRADIGQFFVTAEDAEFSSGFSASDMKGRYCNFYIFTNSPMRICKMRAYWRRCEIAHFSRCVITAQRYLFSIFAGQFGVDF